MAVSSVVRLGQEDGEAGIGFGTQRAQNFKGKTRLVPHAYAGCRIAQHPGRQLGERHVGLQKHDHLDAEAHEPSSNGHRLPAARMERIPDRSVARL
jgi:hypothetical protein